MDYSRFIKKFDLPTDFAAPKELVYQDIIARPLTRHDLKDDMEGVNSSLELIRRTRGGSWPSEAVSEEFDLLDLAWHECEFQENSSFAYVVYSDSGQYIGCFYLFPVGVRVPLSDELVAYDVDASWWVTSAAYQSGYYQKLYSGIQQWLDEYSPFDKVYYSNKEIPA
jgi:hypothetical protein